MGSSASVVAEIVTDVKERLPELQPPPELDDPDSARFRLFDSITSFLKSASQSQPLVIVLDDLHWSDRPSLSFLEFMARELGQSRVLLICTYRDMELNRRHPLTVTLGDLARERLYERVLLRGLTEQDISRFIEIAAGFVAPSQLSATVHRHTEGNPLFVTEVVRELVHQQGKEKNLEVDSDLIEKEIKALSEPYSSDEEFEKALSARNITLQDLKNSMEVDIHAKQLLNEQIKGKIDISDKDVKKYYEDNKQKFHRPELP